MESLSSELESPRVDVPRAGAGSAVVQHAQVVQRASEEVVAVQYVEAEIFDALNESTLARTSVTPATSKPPLVPDDERESFYPPPPADASASD